MENNFSEIYFSVENVFCPTKRSLSVTCKRLQIGIGQESYNCILQPTFQCAGVQILWTVICVSPFFSPLAVPFVLHVVILNLFFVMFEMCSSLLFPLFKL